MFKPIFIALRFNLSVEYIKRVTSYSFNFRWKHAYIAGSKFTYSIKPQQDCARKVCVWGGGGGGVTPAMFLVHIWKQINSLLVWTDQAWNAWALSHDIPDQTSHYDEQLTTYLQWIRSGAVALNCYVICAYAVHPSKLPVSAASLTTL